MTDALCMRLGSGARFDDPAAPHGELLATRRATAAFARVLNDLADGDLTPERRLLIATIGYEARALANGLEALSHKEADQFDLAGHVSRGVTLPSRALRFLIQHSSIHLNVTWRDLDASAWGSDILYKGRELLVSATPKLRCDTLSAALEQLRRDER